MNATPFINRQNVKKLALEIARHNRAQGFTRVGMTFIQRIDAATKIAIHREVMAHPSKGKTLL